MNRRTLLEWAAAAVTAGSLASCALREPPLVVERGVLIRNVNVVGTRDGVIQRGVNVVLDGADIRAVTPASVHATPAVEVVEGRGKYLVPGFLDMHTHAAATLASAPGDFQVLLAHGITGIREASGTPASIAAVRQHNAAVISGRATGPEVLLMPSTLLAGQATTDAAARQFVRDRLAEGADFIKIVGGPPPAVLAAIDEARKQGSHAAGHLGLGVSALAASKAGYRSFEHLGSGMGILLDCSREEVSIRGAALATPVPPPSQVINPRVVDGTPHARFYQRIIDTFDAGSCQTLAQEFARNGSWQTVTLVRLRTQAWGADPATMRDPNLRYVDKTLSALWSATAQQFAASVTPAAQATLQNFYGLQQRAVKLMQDNGVKILAGSDLGGGWVIPGVSLHQEFRELSVAGLTPLQVLQATTLNGAQFVGREATMGTVEAGKVADLVLLDGNPLTDVANLDRISTVFLRGRYLSRAALDQLLADVAAANADRPQRPLAAMADPSHPPHH